MTYEEAINYLKPLSIDLVIVGDEDDISGEMLMKNMKQALDMAIEALEKQIPKKPSFDADGTPRCSECLWDEFYNKDAMRYCPSCGQAINLEGTE